MVIASKGAHSESPNPTITNTESAPGKFALVVTFDGQQFECGTYINRAEAMKAGKLYVERKEGERIGQKRRPRGKG